MSDDPSPASHHPMRRRTRMVVAADLLADTAYSPEEVSVLAMVHHELVQMVNEAVAFGLIADNIDRPDATKYGTHTDGSPAYAPAWYVAMGIKTDIHARLYGVLRDVLSCEEVDEHGHVCIGSILHDECHHDGDGCNWWTDGTGVMT